jgi:hypothetical protein
MLVQPALAHSMYFGNRGEDIPLLFGHPEEGEDEVLPYDPADIEELRAYDLTGAAVPSEIKNFGDSISVIPNEDIAALTAFVNRGFYVVTPDGEYLSNLSITAASDIQKCENRPEELRQRKGKNFDLCQCSCANDIRKIGNRVLVAQA